MTNQGGILTLDLSLCTGFAYGNLRDTTPLISRWRLNGGIARMGEAWVDLQNKLEDFMAVSRPSLVVYAVPFAKQQTSARLGLGFSSHVESSCFRLSVPCYEVQEPTARKHILGRGSFTERDADKRIIKGSGRKGAKEASMEWCRARGWDIRDDNESDAAVMWEYARRFTLSRKQWASEPASAPAAF